MELLDKDGQIRVSENAKIYAYNGDRITNGEYDVTYYEYDKDGKETKDVLEVILRKDGRKFIPAKIFAQDGIKRAVYNNECYMSKEDKKKYNVNENSIVKNQSKDGTVKNVRIIDEETIPSYGQGIGSGAGYIELSNGSYEVDPNLN